MDNDAPLQASRKKPPPGMVIVVALLGIHGAFLIIIGLIAFYRPPLIQPHPHREDPKAKSRTEMLEVSSTEPWKV